MNEDRNEDTVYTTHPVPHLSHGTFPEHMPFIPICMLCPFTSPANLQGPALMSSSSQKSFSFSTTQNQYCPLLDQVGPLYILPWNIPLNMFCLFPHQSMNIWKGRKASWFPLFLYQHTPCYHISSRELICICWMFKMSTSIYTNAFYLPVWLQHPIFSWLYVLSLRPDLF